MDDYTLPENIKKQQHDAFEKFYEEIKKQKFDQHLTIEDYKKAFYDDTINQTHMHNNNEDYEPFDENDYELPQIYEPTSKYIDCVNIFQVYYKTLFNKEENNSMLNGVDPKNKTSTNRSMELFYEALSKYNTAEQSGNINFSTIYDPKQIDLNSFDEIYALKLDGAITKLSPSLFGIITYIAHYVDWINDGWAIVSLKQFD
jgi:hypothetical protein